MGFWTNFLQHIRIFIMDNFVSTVAACVALIGVFLSLKRKGFSYYIKSANSVVSVEEEVVNQVKVFLGETQVENVHLIVMNIRNSGNQSIEEKDFINTISFNFGEDAQFLRLSVVETKPPSLYPVFTHIHGTPVLEPLLLNGGDNFIVNFLVGNWDPDAFEVRGRIVGVKDIKRESDVSGLTKLLIILTGIIFALDIILILTKSINLIQGSYVMFLSYLLLVTAMATTRKYIKYVRAYMKFIRHNL